MKSTVPRKNAVYRTKGMRWLYRALYFFFHSRLINMPVKSEEDEPIVFVANHYTCFGPVSFALSFPFSFSAWVNKYLIDPETAREGFTPGIRELLPFAGQGVVDWLCTKLGEMACKLVVKFGVIPVDRQNPASLMTTMRRSLDALLAGHHLVIFPETGIPKYSLTSVTPFFSGFATVGTLYERKTGRSLRFCPCYISRQTHTIRFGEMVTYNGRGTSVTEETERVSEELNLRIRRMAAESRAEKKPKPAPVLRTVLFFCNLFRLLLVIPLAVCLGTGESLAALVLYLITEGLRILFNTIGADVHVSANRVSMLLSHTLGIVTNIFMLGFLAMTTTLKQLPFLLWATAANGLCLAVSNLITFCIKKRIAGINYFDTLSSNLTLLICCQQLLSIPVPDFAMAALVMADVLFLFISVGFSIALNVRIDPGEDDPPETQNLMEDEHAASRSV